METLASDLFNMFFYLKVVHSDDRANGILVFVVACAIVGIFAVVLDVLYYSIRGESLLKLKHGPIKSFGWVFAWSLGAAIMGYLGQITDMFKVSLAATVIVGFGWPMLLTKLLRRVRDEIEEDSDGIQKV